MTLQARKSGRFIFLSVHHAQEALFLFSSRPVAVRETKNISAYLKKISGEYLLLLNTDVKASCDERSLNRILRKLENKRTGIVYSDFVRREGNKMVPCPLIRYQPGSIRDDFHFGHLMAFSCGAVRTVLEKYGSLPSDTDIALYDLRLKIATDYEVVHIPQCLYGISAKAQKKNEMPGKKSEAHFAYVAKENFARQKKLEKIVTNHLKRIGAYLTPRAEKIPLNQGEGQWKASIIIPVLNRKKTIRDALGSALEQKTDFPFNIIVVDNHSTDGTTGLLKKFAAQYPHVHHIIPERRDLGIGGCWNEAIYSPYCGQYVVQLDSDDLYSSPHTLQKIVHTMRRGRYAMVVGSYTLVNEYLKTIPPGLIDHREWTQANGHNNLLRVNGMGAPRAFHVSVVRRTGFPNVSYGEDYAMALQITRRYKVGRIYENLYWCRRWKDNTDAGLSALQKNRNDFYKDTLRSREIEARKKNRETRPCRTQRIFAEFDRESDVFLPALCQSLYDAQKLSWPGLADAVRALDSVRVRRLAGQSRIYLQYNPARAVNSGAAVDVESISKRPCFLCRDNLPPEQQGILYKKQYGILCNPMPIFKNHFTVVSLEHDPQNIASSIEVLLSLSAEMKGYAVFYNGPACGASAPDHLHFQAVPKIYLPLLREINTLLPVKDQSGFRYGTVKAC